MRIGIWYFYFNRNSNNIGVPMNEQYQNVSSTTRFYYSPIRYLLFGTTSLVILLRISHLILQPFLIFQLTLSFCCCNIYIVCLFFRQIWLFNLNGNIRLFHEYLMWSVLATNLKKHHIFNNKAIQIFCRKFYQQYSIYINRAKNDTFRYELKFN